MTYIYIIGIPDPHGFIKWRGGKERSAWAEAHVSYQLRMLLQYWFLFQSFSIPQEYLHCELQMVMSNYTFDISELMKILNIKFHDYINSTE